MDASRRLALALVVVLGAIVSVPGTAAAATDAAPAAGRILLLVSTAGEEYREAFDETGRVVRPLELDEARLLLVEARQHAQRLDEPLASDLGARLGALTAAIDAHAPLEAVTGDVDALRRYLRDAVGVQEDVAPSERPSAARGRALFAANCVGCHGERGAGDGADAAGLERRPANFTDAGFMRGETPTDFFHVISVGKRLGAMPAWQDVLSPQDRWDVIAHVWTLATSPAAIAEGQGVYLAECAGCHGSAADGRGTYASGLLAPVPDLSTPLGLAARSDEDLFAIVSKGVAATPMPAFERTLSEDQRWKAVTFLRLLSLGAAGTKSETAKVEPAGTPAGAAALADVRRRLGAAVDAYARGDAAAAARATDAYLRFEPLEPRLRVADAALVGRIEQAFLALRTTMGEPGRGKEVAALHERIDGDLAKGEAVLGARTGASARFVQSATIILREGFEVVLIVGALLAYVRRSGNAAMVRPIHLGTLLGIVASVVSAALLARLFGVRPGAAELFEGIAMLVAAVVLFWVSYWIVSKAEAERWQRYIQGKVEHALAAGSGTALAAAAFLAVYREGVETVLFYQALLGSAPAGDVSVGAGFLAGAGLLAVVYVLMARFGLKVPVRQFFLVTGAFLYAMAISFAGRGVHELQETGVIGTTPLAWVPTVEFLGLFPTLESLLAQGVLLACLVYALWVTFRRRTASDRHGVKAELGRLREQAEAMRVEVAGLRAVDAVASAQGIGTRLDGLIGRVRELEARLPGNGHK